MKIGRSEIGTNGAPYIIAEMSANHLGDFDRAVRIVEAAAEAGADAVKLQTYTADTITIDHDGPGFVIQGGLWDGERLYDLYRRASTPWDWTGPLMERGRALGIDVFSSPFDPSAVAFLDKLDVPAIKIASCECVDLPLIQLAAETGRPIILSTGMASEAEIREAVETVRGVGNANLVLLHCVSGYPTPAEESNLRTIPDMALKFGCPVGLSDHTMGTAVPVAALALGAVMIEKHFTLARADGGPDAAFSLEPDELRRLVEDTRTAWHALGEVDYGLKDSEEQTQPFRRSLYVVRDIAAGEALTPENCRSIRPGYGLPPKHLPQVLGRRASADIKKGTPLTWSMLD
ncbi:pseudaminic acid synthase [Hwanghaeella sp.]|uniref:pseudaminic acid synthase n=1 Tax=Hwanghaeella sp. TaxID=2605943 RepID=UPI003CCC271B